MELDAKVVVDLIKTNAATNKPYAPLLYDCRFLLTRFTQAQVVHMYRVGNCCADALAKWGNNMLEGFVVFDRPPNDDLLYLASRDKDGLVVNRVSIMDPSSVVS